MKIVSRLDGFINLRKYKKKYGQQTSYVLKNKTS